MIEHNARTKPGAMSFQSPSRSALLYFMEDKMGVSIGWRPVNPKKLKYVDGGSNFQEAMKNAFGPFPISLGVEDIKTLEGIAACGFHGAQELVDALAVNDDGIEVNAEW